MMKKVLALMALALMTSLFSFAQSVFPGYSQVIYICPDGTIQASGLNLGDKLGTMEKTLYVPTVIPGINNVSSVKMGDYHTIALKTDSTVWASGDNVFGQLGDGTTKNRFTFAPVSNLSGIIAIEAREDVSYFIKSNGTVLVCGRNINGELGIGTTTRQTTAIQIPNFNNVIAISAGYRHTLFLKSDGTVWGCGQRKDGALGLGVMSGNQLTPVQIPGLSGITAVAAGSTYSLFLKSDGTVWACGRNQERELGLPNLKSYLTPTQIPNLSGVTAIATSSEHSLFLKNDGTVWGCGNKRFGKLGTVAGVDDYLAPIQIPGLTGITSIHAKSLWSFFEKNDGTIWGCGINHKNVISPTVDFVTTPVIIQGICVPPAPPVIDYSSMPNTTCVGSTVNTDPSVTGSNPTFTLSVDNSIQINNPKAITKNKNSVFILNDNDAVARYDFNGNLVSNYPFLSVQNIKAFAADDNSNLYAFNGDGNIYTCDSTGLLVNTAPSIFLGSTGNQLVLTSSTYPTFFPEFLFLVDASQSIGVNIIGVNPNDNTLGNSAIYPSDSLTNASITSMAIDNFHFGKRALLADPVNSTLRTRVLYPDGSSNFDYKEDFLIEPQNTAGMGFNFIDTDTTFNIFTVSAASGTLGMGSSIRNFDGTTLSYLDTSITSIINASQPVGMMITPLASGFQFWIADRGQNRILRAFPLMYQIDPKLPKGLQFNTITGKISGTPTEVSAAQTHRVIITTPYGVDTTFFTFAVTPETGVSNNQGTTTVNNEQGDGMKIRYFDPFTCSSLIEITDSVGGNSPGLTEVIQKVNPAPVVLGNKNFLRRVSTVIAEVNDSMKLGLKLMYSYEDIAQYNAANPSNRICDLAGTNCNDTVSGQISLTVLQMHEFFSANAGLWGKEQILHNPITATWNPILRMWVTDPIRLTKLSDFYAGPVSNATGFDCSNTGTDTQNANNYYVWNFDTLFTSGTYVDTLFNQTGCDSIVSLNLTINQTTSTNDPEVASSIHIFPNPSNGLFNIQFSQAFTEPKLVTVFNLLGTSVYSTMLSGNATLDLSNQQSGIYFIAIENSKGAPTIHKVVKE